MLSGDLSASLPSTGGLSTGICYFNSSGFSQTIDNQSDDPHKEIEKKISHINLDWPIWLKWFFTLIGSLKLFLLITIIGPCALQCATNLTARQINNSRSIAFHLFSLSRHSHSPLLSLSFVYPENSGSLQLPFCYIIIAVVSATTATEGAGQTRFEKELHDKLYLTKV